jgi:Alternative complex III, ActD subunit
MNNLGLHGLVAEFATPDGLVTACRKAHDAGYRRLDAYTPYPLEEVAEAIGFEKTRVPLLTLMGGILGGLTGFGMQYWIHTQAYPLNIGGRPMNSWPAFIVITFELTILFAGITSVVGMLALNGLPRPYHPIFNHPRFSAATRDRFFLCIEAADPQFDLAETRRFLEATEASDVAEVAD